jgi:hypothetical protein
VAAVFNRSYQIRAGPSGDFVRVGEMLEELERRADAKLRRRKQERLHCTQLELFPSPAEVNPAKPLVDLAPVEAPHTP